MTLPTILGDNGGPAKVTDGHRQKEKGALAAPRCGFFAPS